MRTGVGAGSTKFLPPTRGAYTSASSRRRFGGEDSGLGFHLCDVETLKDVNFLGTGTRGTAWTGVPVSDRGECSKRVDPDTDVVVVAVDVDDDGTADDLWRGLEPCYMCRPYAATDLHSDGDEELIAMLALGDLPQFEVFDIDGAGESVRLAPVRVAPPEGADVGFAARSAGTRSGWRRGIRRPRAVRGLARCDHHRHRGERGSGRRRRCAGDVQVVKFRIEDGAAFIVEARTYDQPSGRGLPYPESERACGVRWYPL